MGLCTLQRTVCIVYCTMLVFACTSQETPKKLPQAEKKVVEELFASVSVPKESEQTSSEPPASSTFTSISKNLYGDDKFIFEELQTAYLTHQTLYTGGMHFKTLDSMLGSVLIYFALGQKDKDKDVLAYLSSHCSMKSHCGWRNRPLRTLSYKQWFSGEQQRYTPLPVDIISYALQAIEQKEPAYPHLHNNDSKRASHLSQALFDLDIVTSRGEPADWWISESFPKGFGHRQFAVWKTSKEYELMDWLQFTVSSSEGSHLRNWLFDQPLAQQDIRNLIEYSNKRWQSTRSFVWLVAMAEIVQPKDEEAKTIIEEANKLATRIKHHEATPQEYAAFWLMYSNVLRIGSALNMDLDDILNTETQYFHDIKTVAVKRLSYYLAAKLNVDELLSLPYLDTIEAQINFSPIDIVTAKHSEELLKPRWSNVGGDKKQQKLTFLDQDYVRYASLLSMTDLTRLSSRLSPLVLQPEKFLRNSYFTLFKGQLRQIIGSIFLRQWIRDDKGDDEILRLLAMVAPELKEEIFEITSVSDINARRVALFRFVLRHPGFNYQLGVPLYTTYRTDANRYEAKLSKLNSANPEDGNWWCSTNRQTISARISKQMALKFGVTSIDRKNSGGSWGTVFYNPGQKRDYLRSRKNVVKNTPLYEQLVTRHLNQQYMRNQLASDEWRFFEKLPSSPLYFANKLNELSNSVSFTKEETTVFKKLIYKAARRVCKQDPANNELASKLGAELQHYP